MVQAALSIYAQTLSPRNFEEIREFIETRCGIRIPPAKKQMVEGRLRKRLKALGIPSFDEYCDYVFRSKNGKKEIINLIDVITTNKTDFFREEIHFEFLLYKIVPFLMKGFDIGLERPLRVWSAGCSTGEEPYTIAMVLSEAGERLGVQLKYSILATDISTKALEAAARAVYEEDRVEAVPDEFLRRYFMRSKDPRKGLYRIVPELRARVEFRRVNFMDEDYGIREKMDIIFCRNVIIYFSKETQIQVLTRILSRLRDGGYLFLGHSESIHGLGLPVRPVGPTVYQKGTPSPA